jgi:hypothetical protein
MASEQDSEVGRRSWKGAGWAAVGVVVIACVVVVFALTRGSSDSPVGLASTYTMSFDNLTYDIQTDGSLTDVTEDQDGNIRGQMTVGPRLFGTGPFTGTFADDTIDFDGVQNGVYTGTIDAHGVLSGTYTYLSQQGRWTATPTNVSTSDGSGIPWWLWLVCAVLLMLVIGYVVVRRGAGRRGS